MKRWGAAFTPGDPSFVSTLPLHVSSRRGAGGVAGTTGAGVAGAFAVGDSAARPHEISVAA